MTLMVYFKRAEFWHRTGKKAAQKKKAKRKSDEAKILENLLITILGLAKVPVRKIREIVVGDMNRVSKIIQQLNAAKKIGKK